VIEVAHRRELVHTRVSPAGPSSPGRSRQLDAPDSAPGGAGPAAAAADSPAAAADSPAAQTRGLRPPALRVALPCPARFACVNPDLVLRPAIAPCRGARCSFSLSAWVHSAVDGLLLPLDLVDCD
jgi:hypothetical protein